MGHTGGGGIVREEELAAPGVPVLSIAVSVEGDTKDLSVFRYLVFEQDREHVGVVVVDLEMRQAEFFGISRRPEMRMEVGDNDLRPDIEQPLEVGDGLFEIAEVLVFIKVAQELAGDGVAVLVNGYRVLELAAQGEDVLGAAEMFGDALRIGDVAAGPPQEKRTVPGQLEHGVIGPRLDRPGVWGGL